MHRVMPRSLVFLAVALTLALLGSPASAATKSFDDPVGDTNNNGLFDIGKVTVTNTSRYVSVRFRFPPNNYFPGPDGRFEVLIDSNARRSGAELSWSAPLFSEFSIAPVKNGRRQIRKEWLPNTERPTTCGKTVRIDWNPQKGYGRLKIYKKTGCLGRTSKVRVSVKTVATGERTADGDLLEYARPEIDYFPARRAFSPWVRR